MYRLSLCTCDVCTILNQLSTIPLFNKWNPYKRLLQTKDIHDCNKILRKVVLLLLIQMQPSVKELLFFHDHKYAVIGLNWPRSPAQINWQVSVWNISLKLSWNDQCNSSCELLTKGKWQIGKVRFFTYRAWNVSFRERKFKLSKVTALASEGKRVCLLLFVRLDHTIDRS